MCNTKRNPADDTVDGPAVITPDHLRIRTLVAWKGSKKGWSRLTGYEKAYNRGSLAFRGICTSAQAKRDEEAQAYDRFVAARDLDLGWNRCQTPFPPGSDFERVRGGAGTPGGFADHARDTKDFWRRVEGAMSANDWTICRMVRAEGYSIAQAVMTVSPAYKNVSLPRFREALDALVAAMQVARMLSAEENP